MTDRHAISVLVRNDPGVLQRVSGLFSRRGYNIDSISVGDSGQERLSRTTVGAPGQEHLSRMTVGAPGQEHLSRMTVVARGDEPQIRQICSQLGKLLDVVKVEPLSGKPTIERELLLVKLTAEPEKKAELLSLIETFRSSIVDVAPRTLIVQAVGDRDKNDAFLRLLRPYGILEIARTGETAMLRG